MKIKSIKSCGRADVFNITVADTHNYVSLGGVVLKNCDALRGFCVYRSRANRELPKPDERTLRQEAEYNSFNGNEMFDVYNKHNNSDNTYNPMYL